MNRTVHFGTFNAEKFWKDENNAGLPAFEDKNTNLVVAAMDEMLFPFCSSGDILINRRAMDSSFISYLKNTGFSFNNNRENLNSLDGALSETTDYPVCQILRNLEKNSTSYRNIKKLLDTQPGTSPYALSPYAVLPDGDKTAELFNGTFDHPSPDIVKKVNGKTYSCELTDRLGLKNYGTVCRDSHHLEKEGLQRLSRGHIILKESFGVSGKGNLLIQSEQIFLRIIAYLRNQENKGKNLSIIMEDFLPKKVDFSCHIRIHKDGTYDFLSIQEMRNRDQNYNGSVTADDNRYALLEQKGYFTTIEKTARFLAQDGYWGYVCIDSMELEDGTIVPIVEINARKSMGLINYQVDRFLGELHTKGCLTLLSLGYEENTILLQNTETLLSGLEKNGLLFSPDKGIMEGILPLSTGTLFIHKEMATVKNNTTAFKGRLYASVVTNSPEQQIILSQRLRALFEEQGCKIYN